VLGKGGRVRFTSFGAKTATALDRYLRVRGKHPAANDPWLWLGQRGLERLRNEGQFSFDAQHQIAFR
jgi:site-specific recombinase XerC